MGSLRTKVAVTGWIIMNIMNEKKHNSIDDEIKKLTNREFNNFGSTPFRFIACFSAIYLLIVNRVCWKTCWHTAMLIPFIGCTLPHSIYTIFRGVFGYSITFVAIVSRLFFSNRGPGWINLPLTFIIFMGIAPRFIGENLGNSLQGFMICMNVSIFSLPHRIFKAGGFRQAFKRKHILSTLAAMIMWLFTTLIHFEML